MDETVTLSDTTLTMEGPDTTMDSPMKLSYYQSSSPEFSHYSSSLSSGQYSPSPPLQSPFHSRENSPSEFLNYHPSPLSAMDENASSSPTSPSTLSEPLSPSISLRSPSPHHRAASPPSPCTPECSYSPMSTTDSPYEAFSPSPLNNNVSPPPFHSNSPSSSHLDLQSAAPSPAAVASPPPYGSGVLATPLSNSLLHQSSNVPCDLSSPRSQSSPAASILRQPSHPSIVSRISPSATILQKFPFYSISPKSERTDDTTPPQCQGESAPPAVTTASRQRLGETSESPLDLTSRSTSSQEVVDLEGQPCVVDLTCEDDDDDVEIVASEQPVVFLSESTNRKKGKVKRIRHDTEDPVVISDTTPPTISNSGETPATAIEISDAPPLQQSTYQPPNRTPELFGDLLNQSVVLLGIEKAPANPLLVSGGSHPAPGGLSSLHRFGQSRSLEKAGTSSNSDRCRSPLHPTDLGSKVAGHGPRPSHSGGHGSKPSQSSDQGSRPSHSGVHVSRSLIEAPIPPDVLDDLASLCEDCPEGQGSVPAIYRQFLLAEELRRVMEPIQPRPERPPPPVQPNQLIPPSSTGISAHSTRFGSSTHSAFRTTSTLQHPAAHSSTSAGAGSSAASAEEDAVGLCCPICFESFQEIKERGKTLSSTVCGHIFCTECLQASFRQAKQCPTCRKRLNKKQYHPLYI